MIARSRFGARLLAGAIDALAAFVLACLLVPTTGHWFASRAVVMLSIGSPDTFWRGPLPMVLGIFGTLVHGLPLSFLLVLLPEALFGAGLGKWLLGLDVRSEDGTPATARARLVRWTLKLAGFWIMVLALALGSVAVATVALAAGFVVFMAFLLSAAPGVSVLHDRLSRTAVCRRG